MSTELLGPRVLTFSLFPLLIFLLTAPPSAAPATLMPVPSEIQIGDGALEAGAEFGAALTGHRDSRLERALHRFLAGLSEQTAVPFVADGLLTDPASAALLVDCRNPGEEVQGLETDECYELTVSKSRAELKANGPVGIIRGLATLLQLADVGPKGISIPCVRISDRPRYKWRGLVLDPARHWQPPEMIRRQLDAMAAVKLNVLHWHLSDDQGFRVESKKHPRLHQMGSDGKYYTQEQVKDLIEYAFDRGIRVVPEFDMPGHTTAWFVGHPELATEPGPYEIERHWGIFDPTMDPTREDVYTFLNDFIGEMAALFPDAYFHVGGDEVNGKQWNRSPHVLRFMRDKNLKDNRELQAYFNQRLLTIVSGHGKHMVGWEEILHPDLSRDTIIHAWRGRKALAEAARSGHRALLSFGYYLDHMLPASQHYEMDPLGGEAADLTEPEAERILGGEACMWGEFATPETIDSRTWPRTAAIAERLWSPARLTDTEDMYRRLEHISRKLGWIVRHRSGFPLMLQRLVGPHDTQPLQNLLEVLEPVKFYGRSGSRAYTQSTPLNRAVDATRPESDKARVFRGWVDVLLTGKPLDGEQLKTMRAWLSVWRDNLSALLPLLKSRTLLAELQGHSETLSALASAASTALEAIEKGQPVNPAWRKEQIALAERATKPQAELLNMLAPSVMRLVEGAATQPNADGGAK